jgi:hypothetical protein
MEILNDLNSVLIEGKLVSDPIEGLMVTRVTDRKPTLLETAEQ